MAVGYSLIPSQMDGCEKTFSYEVHFERLSQHILMMGLWCCLLAYEYEVGKLVEKHMRKADSLWSIHTYCSIQQNWSSKLKMQHLLLNKIHIYLHNYENLKKSQNQFGLKPASEGEKFKIYTLWNQLRYIKNSSNFHSVVQILFCLQSAVCLHFVYKSIFISCSFIFYV